MKSTTKVRGRLLMMAFMAIPLLSQAQMDDSRFGIKGGVNFTNFYQNDVGDQNIKTGFNVGLFTEIAVAEQFSIQPELLFTTKGNNNTYGNDGGVADFLGTEGDVKFNLSYIEIPVLAKATLGEILNIHLGPYASYLIGASSSTDGDLGEGYEELDRDNFRTWDYGIAAGVGVDLEAVTIGVRYDLGLAKVGKSGVWDNVLEDSKNSSIQLYVAVGI